MWKGAISWTNFTIFCSKTNITIFSYQWMNWAGIPWNIFWDSQILPTTSKAVAWNLLGLSSFNGNHHGPTHRLTKRVAGAFITVRPNPSRQGNNINYQSPWVEQMWFQLWQQKPWNIVHLTARITSSLLPSSPLVLEELATDSKFLVAYPMSIHPFFLTKTISILFRGQ